MKLTQQLLSINEVQHYGKMQRSMDDIPLGGTVIYSSIHDKCYKMSTVRKKNDRNATLGLQNGDTIQLGAVVDTTQAAWNEWKDKKVVKEATGEVQWEMMLKNGKIKRFMAVDKEAAIKTAKGAGAKSLIRLSQNFRPIGKPISLTEDLNEETICSEAVVVVNRLLAEGKIGSFRPPFSVSGNWVNDSKGRGVCEMGEDRAALKDIAKALNAFVDVKESITESRNEPENEKLGKTADKLEVGDVVHISGNVQYNGQVGEIDSFGKDKKFVVVKLYGGKGTHSFHSSDVTEENTDHEDDEDDKEEINKFYVAFYETAEERPWIGLVSREGGGKWHEKHFKGEADHRWGQTYMSYLEPADIMSWIYKDYGRHVEIDGPFMTSTEAEDHVRENWGTIKESIKNKVKIEEKITYTDFDDWKQAVLNSYPTKAKQIKFKGRMEGNKDTISAEVPGEDRSYGVWDQDEEKGVVLSESEDPYKGVTPTSGKHAARNDFKLNKTSSNPWNEKYHKDERKQWDADYTTEITRLKKKPVSEAFKLKDKVKIVKGPKDCTGKDGFIGEIRTDVSGKKTFTIDYDYDAKTGHSKSVQLKAEDIRSLKESTEQMEVINKAHADHGLPKKVFFTGTYDQCIDFMRKHKSLKLDLMYKESGRLASYKL